MKRIDDRRLDVGDDEILGFARVRNEILRLPWCLDFHRRLGVDRFVIVDNDSTDGSRDYLLSREDVHLFWTPASYAQAQSGMDWINELLTEFACGHWTVTIDPDELLIYPDYERVSLGTLTRFLDLAGADALLCWMIDMYSAGPIREAAYRSGRDFLECCPYFDASALKDMRGGARERLFWRGRTRAARPPHLEKVPLVRWRPGLAYARSTHLIEGVRPAAVRGVLLHFKLFSDFHERAAVAVEEQQYWEDSAQYRCYLAGLDEEPGLVAHCDESVRFEGSGQMVRLGFMSTSAEYERFALPRMEREASR